MASDNFNRANENPLASPWSIFGGVSDLRLVSNAVQNAGANNDSGSIYTTSSEDSSQCVIAATGGRDGGPAIHMDATGNRCYFVTNYSGTSLHLFRLSGLAGYNEIDTASGAYTVGDIVRIFRSGNDIVVEINSVEVLRATDTTYTDGSPGLFLFSNDLIVDDWTDAAGAAAPDITDVDTDEIVTATQTNAVITGTGFDTATVDIEQGTIVQPQTIDSQTSTSIQFDVVFDDGDFHLKHGAATLRVTNVDDQSDTIAITIAPTSGADYVDIVDPNETAENRITAVEDIAAGDQLEWSNVVGGDIDDVIVNDDATFECDAAVTAFDVRVWSAIDELWGTAATQSVPAGEITGDLAATEGADVAAISGEVANEVTGDLDATEAADAAAIAGEVEVQGDLASTEAADTAAIAGEVDVQGDLAATETNDTAALAGEVDVSGDLAATESNDLAAFAGEVDVQGDLAATESGDTAAVSGEVDVTGDLAAIEPSSDTAAIAGEVEVQGDLIAVENAAQDTAAIDGSVLVQGDLAAVEGADTAAFNGTNDVIGSMSATEQEDIPAIAGEVEVQGDLAVTEEAADVAAVVGEVDVTGDLSVAEAGDSAAMSGHVELPPVLGILAAIDAMDSASIIVVLDQELGELIERPTLPYASVEALRFGITEGRFENIQQVRLRTKNGDVPTTFVENTETSEPDSVVPGQ